METPKLLIDGQLVDGDLTMDVINPATEEVLSSVRAPRRPSSTRRSPRPRPPFRRGADRHRRAPQAHRQIADVIEANAGELARPLTQEQGKPIADATGEVFGMAAFFRYFASLDLPMKVIEDSDERKVETHRRPLGVSGRSSPGTSR